MLLHRVGDELKEVATGLILKTGSELMHHAPVDKGFMKVKVVTVPKVYHNMDPPVQPQGADEHVVLGKCPEWVSLWPKTQIRLGGGIIDEGPRRNTGATSKFRRDAPIRPPKKPAAVATTTNRQKQLLVGSQPQPVQLGSEPQPVQLAGNASAPQRIGGNDDDDDDDLDVGGFLNTGAEDADGFMRPVDLEPPFRAHADQPARLNAVTQRLDFQGLSQETPPAAGVAAQDKPATGVFSPGTIAKSVAEGLRGQPWNNKPRRPPKKMPKGASASQPPKMPKGSKGASASQPTPMIIQGREDTIPPPPDKSAHMVHEAGKPIVPPEMTHLATPAMISLSASISMLEGFLLKDRDPNYPAFTVQVPKEEGGLVVVGEHPADLFLVAYEDVFNLFNQQRLNYNLVRLYALNEAMTIHRDNLSHVAVADPYYMRDSQLVQGSVTRTSAVEYLERFMLQNQQKNCLLVPFFPE